MEGDKQQTQSPVPAAACGSGDGGRRATRVEEDTKGKAQTQAQQQQGEEWMGGRRGERLSSEERNAEWFAKIRGIQEAGYAFVLKEDGLKARARLSRAPTDGGTRVRKGPPRKRYP